jgi:hypothetical protein
MKVGIISVFVDYHRRGRKYRSTTQAGKGLAIRVAMAA